MGTPLWLAVPLIAGSVGGAMAADNRAYVGLGWDSNVSIASLAAQGFRPAGERRRDGRVVQLMTRGDDVWVCMVEDGGVRYSSGCSHIQKPRKRE